MENASKALLMAGAILIAITIISIAVYIYTSSATTVHNSEIPIDSVLVKMHNKTFLAYDKNSITGFEARECITEVLSNNSSVDDASLYVSMRVELKSGVVYSFAIFTGDGALREFDYNRTTSADKIGEVPTDANYTPTIKLGQSGIVQDIILKQN